MIYDSLDHIDVYKHVHPGVYKGLRILRDTDFSQLPDGKYEVDGEELFYSLMTYQSKPVNDTQRPTRSTSTSSAFCPGEKLWRWLLWRKWRR